MSYTFESFAPQGWQCPICKRIYSPMTSMCLYCGNGKPSYVTSTHSQEVTYESILDLLSNDRDFPKEWLDDKDGEKTK